MPRLRFRTPSPARRALRLPILLGAGLGLAGLAACSSNPVTGRPQLVLMSSEREAELGAEAAAEVERSLGLLDDTGAGRYVAEVGARLATKSGREGVRWSFHVVDLQEPNAFALPGGWVYVSNGLLALLDSEDELAGVLGHEIVHVAARHAAERQTRALPLGVFSALGSLGNAVVGGGLLGKVLFGAPSFAGSLALAAYGRDQEREADAYGQELAAEAGYDPAAMVRFFTTLEQDVALEAAEAGDDAGRDRLTWLDSHPQTPERIERARARAHTLSRSERPPIAQGRAGFLSRIEGLRIGPNPAEGVLRGDRFLHPDLDLAFDFPDGWQTRNGPGAVGGVAPEGDALVLLQVDGRGDDPHAAAIAFAKAHDVTLSRLQRARVHGQPAAHGLAGLHAGGETFVLDLCFIARGGLIYRVSGLAPVAKYEDRAPALRASAGSLRGMTADERASVRSLDLGVARARAGETLKALSRRTDNRWSLEKLAIANGLAPDARLAEGDLVKIAVERPYRGPPDRAVGTRPGRGGQAG